MKKKEQKEFRGLCSDTTFKYLWKNEKTRKILEDLILKITDIDLTDYVLIDNEIDISLNSKVYIMDIVLEKEKNLVNIEMNASPVKEYVPIRNHNYLYSLLGSRYQKGGDFTNIGATQINFNMSYCKEDKKVCISKSNLSDLDNGLVIDQNICNWEIYLFKYKDICYTKDINNIKESYLSMFTAGSIERLREISGENKEMKILVDEIERLNQDEHFIYMYDKELVDKKTMNTAYNEGHQEGKIEERKETAIMMLKDKMDINLITKYTKLPLEEIKKLKEEIDK